MVKLYFIKNPESLKDFINSVRGSATMRVGDSAEFDLKNDPAGFEVLNQLKLNAGNVGIHFTDNADRARFVRYLITA